MIRAFAYLIIGWLLIALVGGLADTMELTVMLPATSAVIVCHVAFSRGTSVAFGLAVAIGLGYLEDLHQGAPVGTLTLAHSASFLALRWASGRLHVNGWVTRAVAAAIAVILVDFTTWATLMALADAFGLRREALMLATADVQWHVLATLLVAPPVWSLVDWAFTMLRVNPTPDDKVFWGNPQ